MSCSLEADKHKDPSMRILHFISSIDRASGGVGMYMQLLAKELGKLVELHVVTCRSENELPIENATLHYIDGRLTSLWTAKRQFGRLLDDVRPDLVHVNACWMPLNALTILWAKRRSYKVVLTPHGMLEPWIMQRHYWSRKLPALLLYQRRAVKMADILHATAESERQNLMKLGLNRRIFVVPNGIDVANIKMKSSWRRNNNILFLSRIHPKKGINFLLEAFSKIDSKYQLTIAGEGDKNYVNELKQLAQRLNISERVAFVGGIYGDEKWKLLRQADVFVLPTHSENFGIVVAEALASGTPVITTKGTPWQELASHHCGWWTEVGAEPTLEALQSFFSCSEEELEAMGRNGRRLVEEGYSTQAVAAAMAGAYKTLVAQ